MEKFYKSENCIKIIAMILVAAMWVGVMFGLYGLAVSGADAPPTNAKVDIEINGNIANNTDTGEETKPATSEEEVETRVLITDTSGSMTGTNNWATDYHTVLPFSDYLGQKNGDSQICTNIERVLSMGVKELGVITDLESYPAKDLEAFEGKNYSNVELIFYVPEDVEFQHIDTYKDLFSEVLDKENSTLIFVNTDGSKVVVFDNYNSEESEEETNELKKEDIDSNISINVEADSGTTQGISNVVLAAILMILFSVIMALIEVILVISMRGHSQKEVVVTPTPVPGGIKEALKYPTAFDGSASVCQVYKQMIEWARNENVDKVYRFADGVEILSLDEAANKSASGNTHGWECLKKMCADGIRDITIVSDMEFNDYQVSGISFESITFVIPAGSKHNQTTLEKVAATAKSYKVITI